MHRRALVLQLLKPGLLFLGEPERNAVFILAHLQQATQRLAVRRQAQNTTIDVMRAFPAKEMPRRCLKRLHAIGIQIGPDHPVILLQQVIAEHIREERQAPGAAVLNEIVDLQNRIPMHKLNAFGHVLDVLVMIEFDMMARVQKGLRAEHFDIAQRPFNPEHPNFIVAAHACSTSISLTSELPRISATSRSYIRSRCVRSDAVQGS